jgi:hypothetical protein
MIINSLQSGFLIGCSTTDSINGLPTNHGFAVVDYAILDDSNKTTTLFKVVNPWGIDSF